MEKVALGVQNPQPATVFWAANHSRENLRRVVDRCYVKCI